MNIKIPNYEILNFDRESLIVSDVGVSKVHSQPLVNVLSKLQLSSMITKSEINELLLENGLDADKAFQYLEKIFPFKAVSDTYFEKIVIIHDWRGKVGLESLYLQELGGLLEFRNIVDTNVVKAVQDLSCFIVIVCYSYNYEVIKKLHFDLAEASPRSAISVCWPMGDLFCIGQPYIPEIGNPCHFCMVDRLVDNKSVISNQNNWAGVLAFCRSKHLSVPFKALSLYQELLVMGAVLRVIKFFTGSECVRRFQDDVLYVSYLQLSDGKIFKDSIAHWYMCDCLRGQ
ncbi:McbB family protein [Pseudomonas poae]|uniref:McbB family protein n=1 Tax=Pseudomonas poae TaxID=200451 RepID=A0AAP2S640_9PSED|nr:McbB family protein [Pseudomonas poae]MCF5658253.1 McbB family protein [Pseudomonas poae]